MQKNSKINIDVEKYPTAKLIHVAHGRRQNQLSAQNVKLNMEGFLNCHLFKNGGRGTKPTYIFMVIILLLVIELKATLNGNPSNDFYWTQKSSSLNVVQYNTTSRPIIIHIQI